MIELLAPNEVLRLIDKEDTTELSRYIRWLAAWRRDQFLVEKYLDQDFSAWDTYHEWLMEVL